MQSILLDRITFGGLAHACIQRNDLRFVRRLAQKWRNCQHTIADNWIPDCGSQLLRFCCGVRPFTEQDHAGENQQQQRDIRDLDAALEIFHLICRDSNPTAPDYGWLIDACIKEGHPEKALFLWDHVKKKNIMMHHGEEEAAPFPGGSLFSFFTRLAAATPESGLATDLADVVDSVIDAEDEDGGQRHRQLQIHAHSCSQLLKALTHHRDSISRALSLFFKLLDGGFDVSSESSFVVLLRGCAVSSDLFNGERLHKQIMKEATEEARNCSRPTTNEAISLIDMYGKCGNVDAARAVFDEIIERSPQLGEEDTPSGAVAARLALWNVMLNALALSGQGKEALELYRRMKNHHHGLEFKADEATLVSLLNACSHAGLVDEALHLVSSSSLGFSGNKGDVTVNRWNCIVSALSRAGRLDEAEALVMNNSALPESPTTFIPDFVTWMALLAGCRWHVDVTHAERLVPYIMPLAKTNEDAAALYLLWASIYGAAGRWKDQQGVLNQMRRKRVRKEVDTTWIPIEGTTHAFTAEDMYCTGS